MITTSTVVMLGLTYLNTYVVAHVTFSETRLYIAVVMDASMAILMLLFMWRMYQWRAIHIGIVAGHLVSPPTVGNL